MRGRRPIQCIRATIPRKPQLLLSALAYFAECIRATIPRRAQLDAVWIAAAATPRRISNHPFGWLDVKEGAAAGTVLIPRTADIPCEEVRLGVSCFRRNTRPSLFSKRRGFSENPMVRPRLSCPPILTRPRYTWHAVPPIRECSTNCTGSRAHRHGQTTWPGKSASNR